MPNWGVNLNAGNRFDLNNALSLGIIATGAYDSDWSTKEGVRRIARISGGALDIRDDQTRYSTENNIRLSGLLGLALDIYDDHQLQFTGLGVRSTTKEARTLEGFNQSEGALRRQDVTEWFERQVWTTQLRGEHFFSGLNDLQANWRVSHSEAFRDAPYETDTRYECTVAGSQGDDCEALGGRYVYRGNQAANLFQFSKIEDVSQDYGLDFVLPLFLFDIDWEWKAGFANTTKERDATLRQYRFRGSVPNQDFLTRRIDGILDPVAIGPGLYRITEVGGQLFPEAYAASLDVDAAYFGFDAQVTPFLRAAIGARYEEWNQQVNTFNTTLGDNGLLETDRTDDRILPAATLTWNFADDQQLRFAASQTLVRPQFRELAFAEFVNSETDRRFRGNPFLADTIIDNFDLRYEWYFGRDQFFTAGLFYKNLENPIEEQVVSFGEDQGSTFINVPEATLQGIELEFERIFPLDQMGNKFLSTKDFVFKTNYTYTSSEISADGEVANAETAGFSLINRRVFDAADIVTDGRELQGQSEHIFNISLGYEDFEARSRASLLFNFAGERIQAVEDLSSNLPAIIEEVPMRLDFVYSREFDLLGSEMEFGFKAQNILNDDYVAFQELGGSSIDVDQYELGTDFSVSLTSRF
jgi:outer membrane receptor protein involved in Fe transport